VTPAWTAWLERWPRAADLAAEPPAEAIRMWGRLGYPRRALRLHACAVALVGEHGGEVPRDLDALLALPGVGTYTARAVAAFAYVCAWRQTGLPLPDGPTRRPQGYAGTDRQARGRLLAVLREATGPVPRATLDLVWADVAQRDRALAGLLHDGVVCRTADGH